MEPDPQFTTCFKQARFKKKAYPKMISHWSPDIKRFHFLLSPKTKKIKKCPGEEGQKSDL